MQDHYAGDIRDFAKYGLLRWLCRPEGPRLGVVWYRVKPDEVDRASDKGGGLDAYLSAPGYAALRACDGDLLRKLKPLRAKRDRSVLDVEKRGVVPACRMFFNRFWTLPSQGTVTERRKARGDIFRGALHRTNERECEIVFLDPDNGIYTRRLKGFSASHRNLKYVLPCELEQFYADGERSVVLIQFLSQRQHGSRKNRIAFEEQIRKRRANVSACVPDGSPIETLVFRCRGASSPLVFFVLLGACYEHITERIDSLVGEGRWSSFFHRER